MRSLSLCLITLRWLVECPVTIIFHNIFSMCFAKPFRQTFSIIIVRNKVLAGDQPRMVSCLYLKQKKKELSFKTLEVWKLMAIIFWSQMPTSMAILQTGFHTFCVHKYTHTKHRGCTAFDGLFASLVHVFVYIKFVPLLKFFSLYLECNWLSWLCSVTCWNCSVLTHTAIATCRMKKATAMQTSNTGTESSHDAQIHYECWIYITFHIELLVSGFYLSSSISK